jgi:putative transcriptional regulator
MTTTAKARMMKAAPHARSRMRREIVDAMQSLRKVGAVSDAELEKTTLRMLGKEALPKVEAMSPAEIAALRERERVSQAVLAAFMNVAVNTVSQWERGEREPTGAALKLLHVVKHNGLDALR